MKRLTRKKVYIDEIGNRHNYEGNYVYIVEKLGRLEDLEEELGCPLEVFVKIMLGKIKEIVVNYGDAGGYEPLYEELTTAYVSGIVDSYEHPDCLCLDTNLCDVPVKDYRKNWWLKGEKDESRTN